MARTGQGNARHHIPKQDRDGLCLESAGVTAPDRYKGTRQMVPTEQKQKPNCLELGGGKFKN